MPQEMTIVLEKGAQRLLRWLEYYPLQRADDILLALAPWERRTTVYRHLSDLERMHLIEKLHVGISPKKELAHLSPFGQYVCDYLTWQGDATKQAQWKRWENPGVGPILREEREKIRRLFPRLPVFVLLQEYINSLVSQASTALTEQGRQATMVQWSWLRDYHHAFVSREHTLRLHVEGALTLGFHFAEEQPSFTSALPKETRAAWYTLFLLHCPLDEPRLLRTRIDRLLRWRESPERTAMYRQMPPIFILATTERQAEWWHQAIILTATRLRVDLPLGAIACLPQPGESFWRLPFRRFGTRTLCHAQELLQPFGEPSVPELLALRGEAFPSSVHRKEAPETLELHLTPPARLLLRSFTVTQTRSAGNMLPKEKSDALSLDYRLPCLFLTARHWEMLRLCFAHPLLSREDLTSLLLLSRTTINLLLADLVRAHYLVGVDTLIGERWQLAEAGLRLLARLADCHVYRLIRFPLEEDKPFIQRGIRGLLHQIRHTAGVYAFFAQLSQALAATPDARLSWWETGILSERHFLFREQYYRFRPDAQASVHLGTRAFRFWLEWDRGTMSAKDLRLKFATYAMYLASREWSQSSPFLPALLCVTPDISQEKQIIQVAQHSLAQVPSGWCMYVTTAQLLLSQGILSSIWRAVKLTNQLQEAGRENISSRKTLFSQDNIP